MHKAKIHGVPLEQQPPATSTILLPASQVGLAGNGSAAEHAAASPTAAAGCVGTGLGVGASQRSPQAAVGVNVKAELSSEGGVGVEMRDVKPLALVKAESDTETAACTAAELILLKSCGSSSTSSSPSSLHCPLCGEEGFGCNSHEVSHENSSDGGVGASVGRTGCAALLEHLVGVHRLAAHNEIALDTLNALVARTASASASVSTCTPSPGARPEGGHQAMKRKTPTATTAGSMMMMMPGESGVRARLLQSIGVRRFICRVCRRSFANKVYIYK